jgi:2-oxoglutarate dehydrogenase E2 component (dihydrolipoamide succinyltransferase)
MSPLRVSLAVALAACAPRAAAPTPSQTAHPLGESTAPGPAYLPPLAVDNTPQSFTSRPLSSRTPAVVDSRATAPAAPAAQPAPAAGAPAPAASAYTGGTSSTIVPDQTSRIPPTPSGVASETTTGTPSGVAPGTPSGVVPTASEGANPTPPQTTPSGTPDQPATGVLAPPPPSEP